MHHFQDFMLHGLLSILRWIVRVTHHPLFSFMKPSLFTVEFHFYCMTFPALIKCCLSSMSWLAISVRIMINDRFVYIPDFLVQFPGVRDLRQSYILMQAAWVAFFTPATAPLFVWLRHVDHVSTRTVAADVLNASLLRCAAASDIARLL